MARLRSSGARLFTRDNSFGVRSDSGCLVLVSGEAVIADIRPDASLAYANLKLISNANVGMHEYPFHKTTLPNGLRVLTEHHPDVHSATIGLWVVAGSIYESASEAGIAHLLEHMVFKGTRKRSMTQIATVMDLLGGGMNAFTEREFVCFHVKVLAEHSPRALELLCELISQPALDPELLAIEKSVVLEEIRAIEDAPEEMVEDLFLSTLWSKSRWGRPIIGDAKIVERLSSEDLQRFMDKHYGPQNVVVVAVGDVQHDKIVALANKWLDQLPPNTKTRASEPREPKVSSNHVIQRDETEGAHLIIGTRAYRHDDPKRFASWALDSIMTGGYSSRLFQEVREKRGLCYSIGGLSACYRTAGFWAVETSVAPDSAAKTADIIGRELRKVKKNNVTKTELSRAKEMARVNLLLSEESSSAQMGRIARNELYYGRQKSTAETLAEIQGVTREAIEEVAHEIFDARWMNFAAIGPFEDGQEPGPIDVG